MSNDKIVDSQNSNLAISAQIWDSGSYILYSVIKSRMIFLAVLFFVWNMTLSSKLNVKAVKASEK